MRIACFTSLLFFQLIVSCSAEEAPGRVHLEPDPEALAAVKSVYEFTSMDGRSFAGKVVLVEADTVTIERHSDGKEFTLPKERFIEMDREYMENWAKRNPQLNVPGRDINRIYLGCRKIDSSRSSSGGSRAFAYVTYNPHTGVWKQTAGTRRTRPVNKTKSVVLQVEASSISGPVLTRIHTFFFAKPKGHAMRRVGHYKDDVLVDRSQGELVVESGMVYGYYGFGCIAVNLASGKVMAVDASNHMIRDYLETDAKSGKYGKRP